ncbi:hypothetical protein [Rhodococcus pseudokoreensis]|uniref:ATP-dependent DNA ligase n=1 Tax=Rhodococcus pseudokoreensis TaxID=2811421 RepID=UPI001F1257CD|nr:hypothetical protein [Rhodococcus pseudokoreensis]
MVAHSRAEMNTVPAAPSSSARSRVQEAAPYVREALVVTPSYPEIAEALTAAFCGRGRIVLDGEVVVLDHSKHSFGLLQRRMGIAHATKPSQRRIPVTFSPFDVLAFDDLDLMSASHLDRRAELAELDSVIQNVGGLPITVSRIGKIRAAESC